MSHERSLAEVSELLDALLDVITRPCMRCGVHVLISPEEIGNELAGCGTAQLGWVHFNCAALQWTHPTFSERIGYDA